MPHGEFRAGQGSLAELERPRGAFRPVPGVRAMGIGHQFARDRCRRSQSVAVRVGATLGAELDALAGPGGEFRGMAANHPPVPKWTGRSNRFVQSGRVSGSGTTTELPSLIVSKAGVLSS